MPLTRVDHVDVHSRSGAVVVRIVVDGRVLVVRGKLLQLGYPLQVPDGPRLRRERVGVANGVWLDGGDLARLAEGLQRVFAERPGERVQFWPLVRDL